MSLSVSDLSTLSKPCSPALEHSSAIIKILFRSSEASDLLKKLNAFDKNSSAGYELLDEATEELVVCFTSFDPPIIFTKYFDFQ